MWKSIIVIKLENYWKFTPEIEGRFFRLRHIDPPKAPIGWIGQAEAIPNTNFHQFFRPQRLNGLSVYETDEYLKPPIFTTRKLGFRQQSLAPNNWLIEVEVCLMPSYSLDDPTPINSTGSNTKTPFTVTINNTPTLILPANPLRKAVLMISPDKLKTVYIDTDKVVSSSSAIESMTPQKPQCVPGFNWLGEYWGVTSSGTVTITGEEYT